MRKLATTLLGICLIAGGGIGGAASASAVTSYPCSTGKAGFVATYWDPYNNMTPAGTAQDLQYQHQIGDNTVIVDWALDQEHNAAWYPDKVGASYSANTIPTLVNATRAAHDTLWMGLVVAPDWFAQYGTNWGFLQGGPQI